MDLSKLVPAFRIEIRRAGSAKKEPWLVAELAHVESHVTARMPYWKNQSELEVRVSDNFTVAVETPVFITPAPAPVLAPLTTPPAIVATAPAVVAPVMPTPTEAITAASPELPFKVGDRLQDIYVEHHPELTVTAINPEGVPGFSWAMPEHETTKSGFVPLASVGCYKKFEEPKAKKHAENKEPHEKEYHAAQHHAPAKEHHVAHAAVHQKASRKSRAKKK